MQHDILLTILGSGTCAATAARSMSGYHIRLGKNSKEILLDIGAGALRRLVEAGEDYRNIDAIFISHFHVDHIADFVPFLWASRYTPSFERTRELVVFAPPGFNNVLKGWQVAFGDWLAELPFTLNVREIDRQTIAWEGVEITTLPMRHSIPANGYRLQTEQNVLAYSGDTGYCAEIEQLADRADLLLIECAFPDLEEELDYHLSPRLVAKIANQAKPKHVVLTHMYPECDQTDLIAAFKAQSNIEIELGYDLKRINL